MGHKKIYNDQNINIIHQSISDTSWRWLGPECSWIVGRLSKMLTLCTRSFVHRTIGKASLQTEDADLSKRLVVQTKKDSLKPGETDLQGLVLYHQVWVWLAIPNGFRISGLWHHKWECPSRCMLGRLACQPTQCNVATGRLIYPAYIWVATPNCSHKIMLISSYSHWYSNFQLSDHN